MRNIIAFFSLFTALLSASVSTYAQGHASTAVDWSSGIETLATARETIAGTRAVAYNHDALVASLTDVPQEADVLRVDFSNATISLPMPTDRSTAGWSVVDFFVVQSDVMHPDLAARYPEIRSFLVQGVNDRRISGRIDLSTDGFHGILHSPKGTVYLDPWSAGERSQLRVYTRREFYASTQKGPMACDVQHMGLPKNFKPGDAGRSMIGPPFGQTRRNYILALACTGEYAQFHGGSTGSALSAMNTTMNRVNSIVERELAIRLILHPNTDQLIYLSGSTDPYTNNNGGAMLGENISTINNVLGSSSYDIGHVFSTGGGGVATGNTLYFLDEPTTGLHFQDIEMLLSVLHRLVDKGNTVLVIEHQLDVVASADHVIDIGPEGGVKGGQIIAQGQPEKIAKHAGHTGRCLSIHLERASTLE